MIKLDLFIAPNGDRVPSRETRARILVIRLIFSNFDQGKGNIVRAGEEFELSKFKLTE